MGLNNRTANRGDFDDEPTARLSDVLDRRERMLLRALIDTRLYELLGRVNAALALGQTPSKSDVNERAELSALRTKVTGG